MIYRWIHLIILTSLLIPPSIGFTKPRTKERSCDPKRFEKIINSGRSRNVHFEVDSVHCEQEWVVTSGTLGPRIKPHVGPQGAPTSFILHFDGFHWSVTPAKKVCGTYVPELPDQYPSDAKIPKTLYLEGCLAG
jgi:hypothetical protein